MIWKTVMRTTVFYRAYTDALVHLKKRFNRLFLQKHEMVFALKTIEFSTSLKLSIVMPRKHLSTWQVDRGSTKIRVLQSYIIMSTHQYCSMRLFLILNHIVRSHDDGFVHESYTNRARCVYVVTILLPARLR